MQLFSILMFVVGLFGIVISSFIMSRVVIVNFEGVKVMALAMFAVFTSITMCAIAVKIFFRSK